MDAEKRPLRERRKRAARGFALRVVVLVGLIGGVAYAAWFSPWAKPVTSVPTEVRP